MTIERDFANPATKKKGKAYDEAYSYVDTGIDRDRGYREWHRTLGAEYCCMDLDQYEYRWIDGFKTPVAFQELSRIEKRCHVQCYSDHEESNGNHPIGAGYRQKAWDRIWTDDQGEMVSIAAEAQKIPAYFVLYRPDRTEFWVRMLYPIITWPDSQWRFYNNEGYGFWIKSLETNLNWLRDRGELG